MDAKFEMEAIANQLRKLSGNVIKKHKWVNIGFVMAGSSLILFLAGAVSYIVRLAV